MNSGGYQVIRNIQDARYGGRHAYVDLKTPDFAAVCKGVGMPQRQVRDLDHLPALLAEGMAQAGPFMIEVAMDAVGPFKRAFAGPPVRS